MRQKFPEGSGGPFDVPGVGRVIEGEEFDWPDDLPPVAGAVPADDGKGEGATDADSAAEAGTGEDQGGEGEAAEAATEPQSRPRARGARS